MVLVSKLALTALLQDLAMAHPVPDLAMAHLVPDLAMAHLVPDLAMAHPVPDQAMVHPVPDLAMEHPVQNLAMVSLVQDPVTATHVVSVATVVNTVPVPRSAMVLVAGLAITPVPSPAIKRHRAAMVNLLATAAEAAMVDKGLLGMASHTASRTTMVDTEFNSHTDATEQTYKRIMR